MKNIIVIGAGVMGREIAYVAAMNECSVVLADISEEQLKNAKGHILSLINKGIERGKMSHEETDRVKNQLKYSADLKKACSKADVIIEAVPEKIELKRNVFELMDKHAPAHAFFATNTSTMSPTEIGSFTARPERVIAMHFFNPVHKMSLIEIVKGLETSDETVEEALRLAAAFGKETVTVNEFPGFITSRISALVGNEAFYMLQEGLGSPEEIDKAIKLGLHYPMGPFELGDLVGLDTRLNNLQYLHSTLGEKYRPSPLLVQYVKAGRLGRKTGRGVYDYSSQYEESKST
ncbi:3-hydroxyacyl-CoA dehydrogenase [Jeotgalibacillus proteolyticus]|uniref:3-hydroxyacyl-CoA dehydrogenase n=1 Tax=Jeotgalibacillus proteolyticus TaxID=2082395 RepID=A0A2S5GH19_9BACL|nr:3-hydroxyacyl-CoA dehydrogenase [Jeotgalibacillus proteolyticus]PPA72279.1 3-hydroxyacyl-CoA dehydrogenase [Jeotgalibacillus proteolyticus]